MAAADNPLLAFFSSSVCRALDEHAADLSGSRPPSLLIRDGKQGKQSFPGSVVRLKDNSTHVVALKGGVYQPSEDVVCLQLSPLAGGQAKRWYPAELAQSVEWIVLGCLTETLFLVPRETLLNCRSGEWSGLQRYGRFRQLRRGKVVFKLDGYAYGTLVVFNDTSELISSQSGPRNF